jgi:hypothetical protein
MNQININHNTTFGMNIGMENNMIEIIMICLMVIGISLISLISTFVLINWLSIREMRNIMDSKRKKWWK